MKKRRLIFGVVLCLCLTAGVASAETGEAPQRVEFPDVPRGDRAYGDLDILNKLGVIEGLPEGSGGLLTMTRYEFAVVLTGLFSALDNKRTGQGEKYRTQLLSSPDAVAALSRLVQQFESELQFLIQRAQASQVEDRKRLGMVLPRSSIYSVPIATLLASLKVSPPFPDVPPNHWAYEAVEKLRQEGIVHGYPDGTYGALH